MCGSFQQPGSIRILEEFEEATGVPVTVLEGGEPELSADERTLPPFDDVLVVYMDEGGALRLRPMYWQLVHDWEKEFRSKYTCFNTRAESLDKPHNEALLRRRRCLLPVVSFFENRQEEGRAVKPRQVYELSLGGRRLMGLGGICSVWTNPADENDCRYSCSIITTEPNPVVGQVHNRMPFKGLQVVVAKVGDSAKVRLLVGGQVAEGDVVFQRLGQLS